MRALLLALWLKIQNMAILDVVEVMLWIVGIGCVFSCALTWQAWRKSRRSR